jgi:hypothetical protein
MPAEAARTAACAAVLDTHVTRPKSPSVLDKKIVNFSHGRPPVK